MFNNNIKDAKLFFYYLKYYFLVKLNFINFLNNRKII